MIIVKNYLNNMKKKLFSIIIPLIVFTFHINSFAQTDTEFWFVAPNVTNGHGNSPIYFRFSAFSAPASIVIEQPANRNFIPITINLQSNESISVDLTDQLSQIQNQPPAQILPYGFKISSSSPIFVYYEVSHPLNPDIFSLKGSNALGLDFIIPFQNTFDNGDYFPVPRSGFDIVATQDNTLVTINLTNNAVNHLARVPFTISLNTGETYSVISDSGNANLRLTGSKVTSSKPIAITIKDDSVANSGCRDLNGDQIVPVNIVGKEYIVVKGFLNNNDNVYAVSTEENTVVSINGNPVATLSSIGSSFSYNLSSDAVYISANKPIYLLHLTGYGCEIGAALLPKIECTGSRRVSFVRSTNEGFFAILFTKSGNEAFFSLNNNSSLISSNSFSNVPGTSGLYKYARITLSGSEIPTGIFSTIENSKGLFHLGIINGSPGGGTRYGYFSNYNTFSYNLIANKEFFCEGENLTITANSVPGASYIWSGPGNFNSNENILTLNNLTVSDSGNYCLQGELGNCIVERNCISINVNKKNDPSFSLTNEICLGTTLSPLPTTSTNGIIGSWSPPLNNEATTTYTFTPNVGQCANNTSTTIIIDPNITPIFTQVPAICSGATLTPLPTTSTNGIIGSWSPSLNNEATTTYTFTPDAGQCALNTTMTININPKTIPSLFTPLAAICSGATLTSLPTTSTNGIKGSWSPLLNNEATTTYTFTPDTGQCALNTSLTVEVKVTPIPSLGQQQIFCTKPMPTIAKLNAIGSAIKWYNSANAVNSLSLSTPLIQGQTYFASQTIDGCESVQRLEKNVNIINCDVVIFNSIKVDAEPMSDRLYIDDISYFPNNSIQIFNRYGRLVWETKGYNNDTNAFKGKANVPDLFQKDEQLPAGTYFYILNYFNFIDQMQKEKNGYLQLFNGN
jgi:hypothetical protein